MAILAYISWLVLIPLFLAALLSMTVLTRITRRADADIGSAKNRALLKDMLGTNHLDQHLQESAL